MDPASRKMHEYLLNQQRKKDEFWMRKYGKQAPVGILPPLPAHAPGAFLGLGAMQAPLMPAPKPSVKPPSGRVALPPISYPAAKGSLATKFVGSPPLFHAPGPIQNFFTRGGPEATYYPPGPGGVETQQQQDPASYLAHPSAGFKLPPLLAGGNPVYNPGGNGRSVLAAQQLLQNPHRLPTMYTDEVLTLDSGAPSPPWKESSLPSNLSWGDQKAAYGVDGAYPQGAHSAGAHHNHQASYDGRLPQRETRLSHPGVPPAPLPLVDAVALAVQRSIHARPLRDLELELTVLKAVKSREDNIERLKIACAKLESHFGGEVPRALSQTNPLVRLFYRLILTLRQRTLDAVEHIAAWRRKTSANEPFIYYGSDYLRNIGADLAFLDRAAFLRGRMSAGQRATEDPFLAEITPDGIPLDEATTLDMRRGTHARFSSDALRIRMARKVLNHYHDSLLLANAPLLMHDDDSMDASGRGVDSGFSNLQAQLLRELGPAEGGGGVTAGHVATGPRSAYASGHTTRRSQPGHAAHASHAAANGGAPDSGSVLAAITAAAASRGLGAAAAPGAGGQHPDLSHSMSLGGASVNGNMQEEELEDNDLRKVGGTRRGPTATSLTSDPYLPPRQSFTDQLPAAPSPGPFGVAAQLRDAAFFESPGARALEVHAQQAPRTFPSAFWAAPRNQDPDAPAVSEPAVLEPPRLLMDMYGGLDDGDFIDATIDAMVTSLQPPYVAHIQPFRFTMDSWAGLKPVDDGKGGWTLSAEMAAVVEEAKGVAAASHPAAAVAELAGMLAASAASAAAFEASEAKRLTPTPAAPEDKEEAAAGTPAGVRAEASAAGWGGQEEEEEEDDDEPPARRPEDLAGMEDEQAGEGGEGDAPVSRPMLLKVARPVEEVEGEGGPPPPPLSTFASNVMKNLLGLSLVNGKVVNGGGGGGNGGYDNQESARSYGADSEAGGNQRDSNRGDGGRGPAGETIGSLWEGRGDREGDDGGEMGRQAGAEQAAGQRDAGDLEELPPPDGEDEEGGEEGVGGQQGEDGGVATWDELAGTAGRPVAADADAIGAAEEEGEGGGEGEGRGEGEGEEGSGNADAVATAGLQEEDEEAGSGAGAAAEADGGEEEEEEDGDMMGDAAFSGKAAVV